MTDIQIVLTDAEKAKIVELAKTLCSTEAYPKLRSMPDVDIINMIVEKSRARLLEVLLTTRIAHVKAA
jgi:hypothetical protein